MASKAGKLDIKLDPIWEDLDWAIGQMLIMGWDGTEVTPQIRSLIEDHHLGSIILTAKNLKSAHETAKIVQELQTIAHKANHPQPLLIALDQENGGVNSLFDEDFVCQFPSAMGIAATGRAELAYEVNKATASAVGACGVNMMLGPVLDVLSNARYQPLGVRATGDDPQEVSQYGIAAMNGIRDAGLACCGKHFPSNGNLDFLGSSLDIPIITQTLEELSLSAIVPFRNAIATGKLDGMFVGGCGISNPSMNIAHACLSEQVVDDLLRNELGFDGVAISECLEMQALSHEIGVQNGVVMAVEAGCDLVLLCRAYDVQLEAIKGLKLGIENGIITRARVMTSLNRMVRLKSTCTSWQTALNPPGVSLLSKLRPSQMALSKKAYDDSITVKSVMVVAVSSPYDFAMDKTIGTYICTFDFTENAMHALVRALCGDFVPKGSMPGTLRKSKKVLKSRQNWIVEEYDRERDADSLQELIKAVARANVVDLSCLETATAASFELFNPKIDETHFVVRNSSTNALYGFAATYAIDRTGILGAIFVDPSKRNHSVGRSLHRRAIRHLTKKRSIKKVQLGTSFPGIFLGIPIGEGIASSWFANNGWDTQFPKRLTNLVINDLSTWTVPEGLLQGIQRASISFDLIHGLDNEDAERVLAHVGQHASPEVLELYRCALQETKACGIVRAKKADDSLLGTIIICSPGSPLATHVPPLMPHRGEGIGGVLAPVVPPTSQDVLILQGLVLMGTRQNKAHKSAKTVLSWVQDSAYEHVVAMGFEILQSFEEITNTPDSTTYIPYPTITDPDAKIILLLIGGLLKCLDRTLAGFFASIVAANPTWVGEQLEDIRSRAAKRQPASGQPGANYFGQGSVENVGDLGRFFEEVFHAHNMGKDARDLKFNVTRGTATETLQYLQDAHEVPYWDLILRNFGIRCANSMDPHSEDILQHLCRARLELKFLVTQLKDREEAGNCGDDSTPIVEGIQERIAILDDISDYKMEGLRRLEDHLRKLAGLLGRPDRPDGFEALGPETSSNIAVINTVALVFFLAFAFVFFSLGFAKAYKKGGVGSFNDADFYFLVQNNVMWMLGSFMTIVTLRRESFFSLAYKSVWLILTTGLVCAILSMPIYEQVHTGWTSMLGFLSSMASAAAVLVVLQGDGKERGPTKKIKVE
ncbi:hypothetical protein ACHAQA_003198 [Verticillium albo-atrum]